MPRKKKPTGGLGRALIKQKLRQQQSRRVTGELEIANPNQSLTEHANTLDEFLEHAALSNRTFHSENQPQIMAEQTYTGKVDGFSDHEKSKLFKFFQLPIPERPIWKLGSVILSREELQKKEKEEFLNWRRKIAQVEEDNDTSGRKLAITPFEKNLEFWRQLWRVIERSHLVVQVIDARNPLLFRNVALEEYVHKVSKYKKLLLIVNKSDFLSESIRAEWKKYFDKNEIKFVFFSARREQKTLDEREEASDKTQSSVKEVEVGSINLLSRIELLQLLSNIAIEAVKNTPNSKEDSKEALFGLVGLPNVGKSSVVNVLLGVTKNDHTKHRVSVAATPGHTKHFQTMDVTSEVPDSKDYKIVLCDCPGLVFPTFMNTKGDLILNGILPIDDIRGRDFMQPIQTVCRLIKKEHLQNIYNMEFSYPEELDYIDPQSFIEQFCEYKKFFGSGRGRYNESQGGKVFLKDFVSGKVLYCVPPPEG
eukprot:snap_masked-scaffold_12-processed-gene-10.38-mRNA-1 protein AED:0.31 eAED:0.31 QI:0/-1/0/1/-1/1/1/0/477